jgi:2-succinyl-5-enolpyruvyl-6-hydroxy-3-cyclohexene-1-carboxylate synthase
MDTGLRNGIWAKKLIDACISQGIDYFCYAPGSRSTPLALAIADHKQAKYTIHFDERGLAFYALGYAKTRQKPAVMVTTSGTAVGNLLPAIMEASNDRVPLIILTADRPPELRDCGANQTCDQVKLFQPYARWQIDLPCPEDAISDDYLASCIGQAILMASLPPAGPVHINCMFREPLFSPRTESASIGKHLYVWQPQWHPAKDAVEYWIDQLSTPKQGIILVGSSQEHLSEPILSLAERLQWPIFADVLSPLRNSDHHPNVITHFDPILKFKPETSAEAIIQFGDRFVSRTLREWLERQKPDYYLHVSHQPVRQDPNHLASHRVLGDPILFCRSLLASLPFLSQKWLKQWQEWNQSCEQQVEKFFASNTRLTEPGIVWEIAHFLADEDWNLFLANSMPVRDANQFFPALQTGPIFGNRGVSGIDGNVATACGLAQGNGKATLALVGDLALLHDLNSLALVTHSRQTVIICVINNHGGGIFSFLPISQEKKAFESFFATAHQIHFEAAAKLFGLPYIQPQTIAEFQAFLSQQGEQTYSCLVELTTERAENVQVHQHILTSINTCLNLANSPAATLATLH